MYYFLFGIIIYAFLLTIVTERDRYISGVLGIFVLIFITFLFGLRYGVGMDYFSYEDAFNTRYDTFSYEPLYSILMYLTKILFDKFYYLTFMMIFITNFFIYLGLKKRDIKGIYLILAIFIYSSNTVLIFMNAMRQGVSVAVFFYASTFIEERNFKKYILFLLIAAGFHYSALLLLPMYFIYKINFSRVNFFVCILICYILVYTRAAQTILSYVAYRMPIYSKYYNHKFLFNENINLLSMGVLINTVFLFILLFFQNTKDKSLLEKNYYMIGVLTNILTISSFMFDRVGIYFSIFGIVAIPKIIATIRNKNLRAIFFVGAGLVALIFFSNNLFVNSESIRLEYKSIFSVL